MALTREELLEYALLADRPYVDIRRGPNMPVVPLNQSPVTTPFLDLLARTLQD